jgi:uncharacterized LabA/DUF88 family protein
MAANPTPRLALLIDADNAQPSIAKELIAEVAKYGIATVKRAYGDWTTPNLVGWKKSLLDLAIQPIQQFAYTPGKNATDSALIIDAMDLLHGGVVDAFCLVSSDSDFTRLATRIREAGLSVYGFGERKTPKSFVSGCDKFTYTENLRPSAAGTSVDPSTEPLRPLLEAAIVEATRDDKWAALSNVGHYISKADPAFDPRTYGVRKLSELVRAQAYVEVKEVPSGDGSPSVQYFVRLKSP